MDAVSVILDPKLNMLHCDGSGWEPEHIASAKDGLLQVADEDGATASPVDITVCPEDWEGRLFGNGKRLRVDKESEIERYLAVASDEDVLEWWVVEASQQRGSSPGARASHGTILPFLRPVLQLSECSLAGPI